MVDRANQQGPPFTDSPVLAEIVNQAVMRTASRQDKTRAEAAVPALKADLPCDTHPLCVTNNYFLIFTWVYGALCRLRRYLIDTELR